MPKMHPYLLPLGFITALLLSSCSSGSNCSKELKLDWIEPEQHAVPKDESTSYQKRADFLASLIKRLKVIEPQSVKLAGLQLRQANNLAEHGHMERAIKYYHDAVRIYEKLGREDSYYTTCPEYISSLEGLADCYYQKGEIDRTGELYLPVVQFFKTADPLNPSIKNIDYRLAKYYIARGDQQKAEKLLRSDLFSELDDRQKAIRYSLIGTCNQELGFGPEAAEAYSQALTFWKRLPDQKKNLAICLFRLGEVRASIEDRAGAVSSFEQALPILKKEFGDRAPITKCASAKLADALWSKGNFFASIKVKMSG